MLSNYLKKQEKQKMDDNKKDKSKEKIYKSLPQKVGPNRKCC